MFKLMNQFKIIGDERNLTKASEILGISQPTLTKNIARLEKLLEVTLYERTSHGIELTKFGEDLYINAARMLNEYEHSIYSLENLKKNNKRLFSIGCGINWTHTDYINPIKEVAEEFEDLTFNFTNGESIALQQKLLSKDYDMVMGTLPYRLVRDKDIVYIPVFKSEYSLFVSEKNPLASFERVTDADLNNYHWVVYRPVEGLHYKDDPYEVYVNPNRIKFNTMSITTSLNLVKDTNYVVMLSSNLAQLAESYGLARLTTSESVNMPSIFESGIMYLSKNRLAEKIALKIIEKFPQYLVDGK